MILRRMFFRFCINIILFLLLLFPNYLLADDYTVPLAAYSICAEDLDLDGDNDIVVGHNYCSWTEWSGISILENNGEGVFTLIDSIFLYSCQTNVYADKFNDDEYPDIIGRHYENDTPYMAILENEQGVFSPYYYPIDLSIDFFTIGDVNSDSYSDVIIANNSYEFWGIMYNDGLGSLSLSEYYDIGHPGDIVCGKLNEDDRDDIIVRSDSIHIFFSYDSGFETYSILGGGTDIEIADLDNDGDNDIVGISNIFGGTGVYIYENIGNNEFVAHPSLAFGFFSTSLKLIDLNNDYLSDLVCAGSDNGFYTIMNEGDLTFLNPVFTSIQYYNEGTRRICCADFDDNGYMDVAMIRHIHISIPANLTIVFNDGTGNFVLEPQVSVENYELGITNYKLSNYPNPFNPTTTISFSITEESKIELSVYNIKGQKIKTLLSDQISAGEYSITWNGKDDSGKKVSSGIYLYKLYVNDKTEAVKKCLMLK